MILKNGKRIDGLGDSMPIGSIIEYNGTDIPDGWELVAGSDNDKINYIQCGFNEAFWVPDTNYKLLTFNNIRTNGDLFSYDSKTNEVVVSETASIDEVKLHFHTMITAGGELPVEAIEVIVYKNDAIAAIINDGLDTASSRSATSLDRIVDCAPGDRFRVEARSYDNIYQMLSTYGRTAFIIEEVADNNVVVGGGGSTGEVNLGVVLYDNEEGSNQDITVDRTLSDFEYYDIVYGISSQKFSKRIPGDTPSFTLDRWVVVDGGLYSRITTYDVVNNTIKVKAYTMKYDSNKQVITETSDGSPLAIFKIVGYMQPANELIIEEKQPSAITAVYDPSVAGASGNWTLPESNASIDYPINSIVSQTGTELTLDTENNCITVGKGISTVLVLTKITYVTNQSGSDKTWATYITKNKANYSQATFTPNVGVHNNINNSVILNVEEGDQIRMPFYGQAGDAVGRATNTNISVIELTNNTIISESDNELNLITDGDPVKAGYKIDGKDVYVKRVFVPSLPNNALLEVDSGVPNTYEIEHYVGTVINSNKYTLVLPSEGTNYMRAGFDRGTNNYKLQITTNSDRTTWKGYFNIYYY